MKKSPWGLILFFILLTVYSAKSQGKKSKFKGHKSTTSLIFTAGTKAPFEKIWVAQADFKLENYRLGFGTNLAKQGESLSTFKETFTLESYYAEFGLIPFGKQFTYWDKQQCYLFSKIGKTLPLLSIGPLVGLGYHNTKVQGSSAFLFPEQNQDITESYQVKLHYPYLHGGIEVFFWRFYASGTYKIGLEIPYHEEKVQFLEDAEELWGFRIADNWQIRVGLNFPISK